MGHPRLVAAARRTAALAWLAAALLVAATGAGAPADLALWAAEVRHRLVAAGVTV